MYLFASILNEMFSSYVSLNSFTQLTVTGTNTRVVYKWEPKSGQPLPDLKRAAPRARSETRGASRSTGSSTCSSASSPRRPRWASSVPSSRRARPPAPRPVAHLRLVRRRASSTAQVPRRHRARARDRRRSWGSTASASPLPPHFVGEDRPRRLPGRPAARSASSSTSSTTACLSLVYRAWTKYRFAVMYRTKGDGRLHAADVLHRRRRRDARTRETALNRFLHLRYAPLLASKSRSARGLEVVLERALRQHGREDRAVHRPLDADREAEPEQARRDEPPARREPDHRPLRVRRHRPLQRSCSARSRLRRLPLVPARRAQTAACSAPSSRRSPAASTT